MSTTLEVLGQKCTVRNPRRFAAVAVRPEPHTTESGTYVAFARVIKTSDNLKAARRAGTAHGEFPGGGVVIIDTTTGEEL